MADGRRTGHLHGQAVGWFVEVGQDLLKPVHREPGLLGDISPVQRDEDQRRLPRSFDGIADQPRAEHWSPVIDHLLDPEFGLVELETAQTVREGNDVVEVAPRQLADGTLGHENRLRAGHVLGEAPLEQRLTDHAGIAGREEVDIVILAHRFPLRGDQQERDADDAPTQDDDPTPSVDQPGERLKHEGDHIRWVGTA